MSFRLSTIEYFPRTKSVTRPAFLILSFMVGHFSGARKLFFRLPLPSAPSLMVFKAMTSLSNKRKFKFLGNIPRVMKDESET